MPITIKKSKSKTNPFYVLYSGDNNEPLSHSQNLKTKQSCWKNIFSMGSLMSAGMESVYVRDQSGKRDVVYLVYLPSKVKRKV